MFSEEKRVKGKKEREREGGGKEVEGKGKREGWRWRDLESERERKGESLRIYACQLSKRKTAYLLKTLSYAGD